MYTDWETRLKAFDKSTQEWRSIRKRSANKNYEMKLIQFAKIRNNSVPWTFDHYKDAQYEYLVQEWIDGHDLNYYIQRIGKDLPCFTARRSYNLFRGLVTGLNKLHERNVFHGDIKPKNIIVAGAGRLIMIDYGTARGGTRSNHRDKGTTGYASPEQWNEHPLVDYRADQFSASVVLYQMLTGVLPYDGRGGWGSDYARHPSLIAPSKKNREVWPALDRVVMKGLNLDKNQRYETSASWLEAFYAAAPPSNDEMPNLLAQFSVEGIWNYFKRAFPRISKHVN